MKRTLLQIVQNILSDMDSEDVNSISDSIEAEQIASVVRDVYYNMVSTRMIPEHKELFKLTSLSDSTRPTHFLIPETVNNIETIQYNVGTSDLSYKEIKYMEPLEFLMLYTTSDETDTITDVNGGTSVVIRNNKQPEYYTSFDDSHLIMDSYDSSVSSTLTSNKTRCYGRKVPVFTVSDDFTPDLDDVMFPYLIAESKSTCFSLFKSGPDQKIEQAARRQKSYVQNDMYKINKDNKRPKYGRR